MLNEESVATFFPIVHRIHILKLLYYLYIHVYKDSTYISTARNVQWFQASGQLLPSCVLWVRSHMGQHDVLTRDILCVLFINESKIQRDKRHVPSTGVVFFKYKKVANFIFNFTP